MEDMRERPAVIFANGSGGSMSEVPPQQPSRPAQEALAVNESLPPGVPSLRPSGYNDRECGDTQREFQEWYRDAYLAYIEKTDSKATIDVIVDQADLLLRKHGARNGLRILRSQILITGLSLADDYSRIEAMLASPADPRTPSSNCDGERKVDKENQGNIGSSPRLPRSEVNTTAPRREACGADVSKYDASESWFAEARKAALDRCLERARAATGGAVATATSGDNVAENLTSSAGVTLIHSCRMRECQLQIALYLLLIERRHLIARKHKVKDKSKYGILKQLDDHIDQLCLWATLGGPLDVVDFGDANDAAEEFVCSPVIARFSSTLSSVVDQIRSRCGVILPGSGNSRIQASKSKRKRSPKRLIDERSKSLSEVIVSPTKNPANKAPLSPNARKLARYSTNSGGVSAGGPEPDNINCANKPRPPPGSGRIHRISSNLLSKFQMECTIKHKRGSGHTKLVRSSSMSTGPVRPPGLTTVMGRSNSAVAAAPTSAQLSLKRSRAVAHSTSFGSSSAEILKRRKLSGLLSTQRSVTSLSSSPSRISTVGSATPLIHKRPSISSVFPGINGPSSPDLSPEDNRLLPRRTPLRMLNDNIANPQVTLLTSTPQKLDKLPKTSEGRARRRRLGEVLENSNNQPQDLLEMSTAATLQQVHPLYLQLQQRQPR